MLCIIASKHSMEVILYMNKITLWSDEMKDINMSLDEEGITTGSTITSFWGKGESYAS